MDLDELDGARRAPSRASKFAPKGAKPKPKLKIPKPEPGSNPLPAPNSEPEIPVPVEHKVVEDVVPMEVDAKEQEKNDVANDMVVEEEDCVVREIDVFLNPAVDSATQLYVLQYPLRPRWRPYELEERCLEVRLKPTSSEVEIDLSVDPDSKNYDGDGDHKMQTIKETLSSSSMKPGGVKGIAVGVLKGNKLHINPIRAAVQLRPSRGPALSVKKTGAPRGKEVAIKSEHPKDEKSPGPSRKQNNPPGRPSEDAEAEENWVPLKHYSADSEFSARYLEKMAGTESSPIKFSMSTYNYINSICPGANADDNKPITLALRALHSLPLEERFSTWFREHPCANRFATLKHLAPDDPIEDVFTALQKVACLVQGLWVPKSSFLAKNSILAEGLEELARDFVLLMFSNEPTISYAVLDDLKPKVSKAVKGALSTLANDRSTVMDWKFKETTDESFMKRYGDIYVLQQQNWHRAKEKIIKSICGPDKSAVIAKLLLLFDKADKPSAPKAAVRSGTVAKTLMSNETREALPKILVKLFHTHGVLRFPQIRHRLESMVVFESSRTKVSREWKIAKDAVGSHPDDLMEIINQVATNIHGVYVLKQSPENPELDPFRKVIMDLLIAEGPNAKLKKASILAAAKVQLNKEVTDQDYNKVLKELCVSQGASWSLKDGDGKPI